MNNISLVGRSTCDPDFTITSTDVKIAKIRLAVDRDRFKEGQQKTDFINIKMIGKLAEITNDYIKKGYLLSITGRLQLNEYEKGGERRTYIEVIANTVRILNNKKPETSPLEDTKEI